MIYYTDLIGIPHVRGGRSMEEMDCYGVSMECRRRDGNPIPDFRTPVTHAETADLIYNIRQTWTPIWVKGESDGSPLSHVYPGALLHLNTAGHACHVGYVLNKRQFIHSWEATGGVGVERLKLWKRKILGIYDYPSQ